MASIMGRYRLKQFSVKVPSANGGAVFSKSFPFLQEATEKEPSHLEEVVSSLMIARVPYSPLITRMNRSLKSWRLPAVIRKNQGTRPAAEASTCL